MIRHLEHNHTEMYEVFLRESHGLDQSEDVNPLLKKPKKRNLNMKGSNEPEERTCPDCGKEYSCRPAMLFHYKVRNTYLYCSALVRILELRVTTVIKCPKITGAK